MIRLSGKEKLSGKKLSGKEKFSGKEESAGDWFFFEKDSRASIAFPGLLHFESGLNDQKKFEKVI